MFLSLDPFEHIYSFTPQLLSILLTTLAISIFCIVYNKKIRNHNENEKLSGFLVLTEMFITSVENLVVSIMGTKYRKLTPYVMYILLYILVSSVISLLGIEPLASSYTVTFSMGLVTFGGIYYFGIKYQKLAFFKKFLNPIELITQFVPLISISFRLFGNILGGTIILGMLYGVLIGIQTSLWTGINDPFPSWDIWGLTEDLAPFEGQMKYWWAGFNLATPLILPWLHLYFDLFDGGMQSLVFVLLTLSYWGEAMGEHEEEGEEERKALPKKQIKIKQKIKVDETTLIV